MIPKDDAAQDIWELLLCLAANQYNRGKRNDLAGDNFSKIVTPIHTQLLALITAECQQARLDEAQRARDCILHDEEAIDKINQRMWELKGEAAK